MEGHDFDIKPFSRLMSLKETKALTQYIRRFTEIDCFKLYKALFDKPKLLRKLSAGLRLPDELDAIVAMTKENLAQEELKYEDAAPLIYLKLRMEGGDPYPDIRQLVIDEAQDYYPIHYEIFRLLFTYANYTVVGDAYQAIEKNAEFSMYDEIVDILDKRKAVKLFLNKSYRSSYEINSFTRRLQEIKQDFVSFERHEEPPELVSCVNEKELYCKMENEIRKYLKQGYGSVAVICKTQQQAVKTFGVFREKLDIKLVKSYEDEVEKGVVIIPSYMAKGMEFDAVIVEDVSESNYCTMLDKKLLYIACTRALHRLSLYFSGQVSSYLH